MANDATKVSFGKPKVGGAVYVAPAGTTLPTSADGSLNASFVCLGYISEDGVKNNNSPSVEKKKAWGGDTVATSQTERPDEWSFMMIEALNPDVLKAVYGSGNVTGALATGLTVSATSEELQAAEWVIDMVMTGNVAKRTVIPNGKITEVGETSFKDNDIAGYDVTISAMPGPSTFGYATHKDYYKTISSGGSSS